MLRVRRLRSRRKGRSLEIPHLSAYEKVFVDTLQAVTLTKFTIQQQNRDEGTIVAQRACWVGSCNYGSLLITFTKTADGVDIQATFTERSISMAPGPASWGKALGKELKKDCSDVTMEAVQH